MTDPETRAIPVNVAEIAGRTRDCADAIISGDTVYSDKVWGTLDEAATALETLAAENARLKHEVGKKDRALHARNIALDGMAWVWCNGGCEGGVFRFTDKDLTPEILGMIERNTVRLKQWAANRDYRAALSSVTQVKESGR